MELILNRFCWQPPGKCIRAGILGQLTVEGEIKGYTVEPPWKDNQPFISCIPDGAYKLIPHESRRYGKVFMLVNPFLNVYAFMEDRMSDTDRYKCYFTHKGSYPWNFEGCIGLGNRLATDPNGQLMAVNTTQTCEDFMDELPREEHSLIIYSPIGAI